MISLLKFSFVTFHHRGTYSNDFVLPIISNNIPQTEEPGGLQVMGLQRVGHDQATEYLHTHTNRVKAFFKHIKRASRGL